MSLTGFIEGVRIGASFLSPEVWTDSPNQSANEFARSIQLADIWLTPAVVEGFSERDFVSLSSEERAELREAVEKFRSVAATVPANKPAPRKKVEKALPEFLKIVKIVGKYLTPEAMDARRAIWRAWWPHQDWIAAFDFKLDEDSTGQPAVWVWLILNNDVDVTTRATQLRLAGVRNEIRTKLIEAGIDRGLYVSVWKRAEVAPVVLGGAKA